MIMIILLLNNHIQDKQRHLEPMVTQGAALEAFYGPETAAMYDVTMDDELKKVVGDLDFACAQAPAGAVLDTCVGTGHYLAYVASKGREIAGIDLSEAMLERARRRLPSSVVRRGNMLEPLPDGAAYAIIFNNFALHHATAEEAEQAIRSWSCRLIAGGILYVSVWEGRGAIDYEGEDMASLLVAEVDLTRWIEAAGLHILRRRSHVEADMNNMNTLYILAQKP